MLIPPFWQGRRQMLPAGNRLSRFRAVVRAAQSEPLNFDRLAAGRLRTVEQLNGARDVEDALAELPPITESDYRSLYRFRRPALRSRPEAHESRSGILIPYGEARAGLETCRIENVDNDLYSPAGVVKATHDLYRLSQALGGSQKGDWRCDHAMAVFSGFDAGTLSDRQRDELWNQFQVPLFEQFLGSDGRVIASECEVHAGMHIRTESAVVEVMDGEIVFTSLTDEEHPALRVQTGLYGGIETEMCDCGQLAPRILQVTPVMDHHGTKTQRAFALA